MKSYACEPLIAGGRLLGTLSFGSTYRSGYSDDELHLFALLAQQISIATERRAQNERVRQLERLATAGRMSATLAHEINNPLESLGHLVYLLRAETLGEGAKHLLEEAERQISQLSSTVQHTLELFRGGQQSAGTLDLGQLSRDLVAGLHLPRHARLDCQIAEEPVYVHAIPGELRQVLFNLLMNAAHFSAPGKAVTLKVNRRGKTAEVRVRDEGPGISGETRSKLFEPFFTTRAKKEQALAFGSPRRWWSVPAAGSPLNQIRRFGPGRSL